MFRSGCAGPARHHHDVDVPGEPRWHAVADAGLAAGPLYRGSSRSRSFPAIRRAACRRSSDPISCPRQVTGELLAIIDGGELTARRTAAASALAASYLARADASVMLMIGTGRLSANLIEAHAAVQSAQDGLHLGPRPGQGASRSPSAPRRWASSGRAPISKVPRGRPTSSPARRFRPSR